MWGSGKKKIAIIGAGNVATHLAAALAVKEEVVAIAARSVESASQLADKVGAIATTDLRALPADCDLYLIAVNDDAIKDVVVSTPNFPGIWAHTSGSVGMEVFAGKKTRYGVFYPLQTFSKNASVNISEVPILVEGADAEVTTGLREIASSISENVILADSASRENIHRAAVFACNFANLMWVEADKILRDNAVGDISLFLPLLRQTLGKLTEMTPYDAMTGPARRGDKQVISKHLRRLESEQKEIYSLLTDRILQLYSNPETK